MIRCNQINLISLICYGRMYRGDSWLQLLRWAGRVVVCMEMQNRYSLVSNPFHDGAQV